jgi:long-chain acyl-CoA synthetase
MQLQPHPTVVHMLRETAEHWPSREAIICGSERLSYAEYLSAVATFAHELVRLGARGERVALVLGNGVDVCISTFAAHAAGAQVVPLNPLYTARELRIILADAAARVVVCDAAVAGIVESLAAECGARQVIVVGGDNGRRLTRRQPGLALPEPLPRPEDLGTLQYTGGTTGVSKGVDCLHRALAVNIAQRDALVPAERDGERILCVMPL